jgi:hypothetical protein
MAQKWNAGTGKSKAQTAKPPVAKTPVAKPSPQAKSGNPNGNKRQAPSVTVS